MQPKIQTYIVLEEAVRRVLMRAVAPELEQLSKTLREQIGAKRWADAHETIRRFNLDRRVLPLRPQLEELMMSSVLFGASRHRSVYDTHVRRSKRAPIQIKTSVEQIVQLVARNAEDVVRDEALKILNIYEDRAKRPALILVKASDNEQDQLAELLRASVFDNGAAYVDIASNLVTSRLASFGFLSEAQVTGVKRYQITAILDDRTCPVCQFMDGKRFDVDRAHYRSFQAATTEDPDDLKQIAPWPKQNKAALESLYSMSEEELQQAGYDTPPFHPSCRCLLVPVDETVIEPPEQNAAQPFEVDDQEGFFETQLDALRRFLASMLGKPKT